MKTSLVAVLLAACGFAQDTPSPLSLADLERWALQSNPSLQQAGSDIRAAEGMSRQAGLYPNPVLGATGDQVAPGQVGAYGGFVEQRIVTGGKLAKSRRAAEQSGLEAKARADAEKYRVLNSVRRLFYRALGDQRLIDVRMSMVKLASESVLVSSELANVGLADKPDLLSAKVEASRVELSLAAARNARERTWRELAAVVNKPDLEPGPLSGDLEHFPKLEREDALARVLRESPQLEEARAAAAKTSLLLRRAEVEKIPDVQVRGGVRYNRELLEGLNGLGRVGQVGVEGFFDVGVEIPLFNRNQGGVAAAKADSERARLEVERASLEIRKRLARAFQEYQDAASAADRYQTQMIPAAQEAYDLYLKNYRAMSGAYAQVLMAQRTLFQLQEEYVNQLVMAWQASVEINGFLY